MICGKEREREREREKKNLEKSFIFIFSTLLKWRTILVSIFVLQISKKILWPGKHFFRLSFVGFDKEKEKKTNVAEMWKRFLLPWLRQRKLNAGLPDFSW
jgi:hypothetical protein